MHFSKIVMSISCILLPWLIAYSDGCKDFDFDGSEHNSLLVGHWIGTADTITYDIENYGTIIDTNDYRCVRAFEFGDHEFLLYTGTGKWYSRRNIFSLCCIFEKRRCKIENGKIVTTFDIDTLVYPWQHYEYTIEDTIWCWGDDPGYTWDPKLNGEWMPPAHCLKRISK